MIRSSSTLRATLRHWLVCTNWDAIQIEFFQEIVEMTCTLLWSLIANCWCGLLISFFLDRERSVLIVLSDILSRLNRFCTHSRIHIQICIHNILLGLGCIEIELFRLWHADYYLFCVLFEWRFSYILRLKSWFLYCFHLKLICVASLSIHVNIFLFIVVK